MSLWLTAKSQKLTASMPLKLQHDEMPNLNLTSLIDVVFLLIVFFMAASKFTDAQRDIVRSISLEGQSIAATAARLAMTEGAVRVALHRSLKLLASAWRSATQ